jgi:peptidoglycan/LPS O-acetylase OafA/YrhL
MKGTPTVQRPTVFPEADKIDEITMETHADASGTRRLGLLSRIRPSAISPAASAHLDLVRAFAAWAVMWGHVRAIFFVDYQQLREIGPFLKVLYFVTGFGHQAVMVFFVLSGFLISSTAIQSWMSGRWSWREYAINRWSRLHVVLIPGLLLGLLWDKTGSIVFASTGLYSHPLEGFGGAIAQNQITTGTFLGNAFFLQTIVCPTFGSNGPLWSLSNEWWYYVLFPVALFAGIAWAKRLIWRAMPLALLVVCLSVFLGSEKMLGFIVWMTGCGLVFAHSGLRQLSRRWLGIYSLIASLVVAGCLTAARIGKPAALGSDLSVGIAFTLFLFGVLHVNVGGKSESYATIARFLAGFSYSLYVLHFPLLLFVRAWVAPTQKWQPDPQHLLCGLAAGAVVLGYAWLMAFFTENRTRAIRDWMRTTIPRFGSG